MSMRSGTWNPDRVLSGAPEFETVSGVYALVDPRTDRTMYVGQSADIEYRYRQHLDPRGRYESNIAKERWLKELKKAGLKPVLVILEPCGVPESDEAERRWIRHYRGLGQCELNISDGGQCNRGSSRLSRSHRDDWIQLGRKIKAAHVLLIEIKDEVSQLVNVGTGRKVNDVIHALDRVKFVLDEALRKAFPEWTDFARVLYGPKDVDPKD